MKLNHRMASYDDVKAILANLSDVTRSEINAVGINASADEFAKAMLAAGPAEVSLADDVPLFVVGHSPLDAGRRVTWCVAGKAAECLRHETLEAATSQVERMITAYPHDQFTSVSYSTHPKRDWFFAAMGFHKTADYGDRAVFELLPAGGTRLDS
jgi:hypothetical protein